MCLFIGGEEVKRKKWKNRNNFYLMRLRADLTLCSCLHLFFPPSRDYNTSARSNVSTRAHWVRLKRTAIRIEKRVAKKKVCYLVRHELGQYHLRIEGVRPSALSAFTFPLNQPRHPCLSSLSITARTDRVGQKKGEAYF
jgi:hypothetical protein